MKKLSDQLREAIVNADVSRYEISKATGVTQAALSHFVNRRRGVSVEAMDAVGLYLGLSITSRRKKPTTKKEQ